MTSYRMYRPTVRGFVGVELVKHVEGDELRYEVLKRRYFYGALAAEQARAWMKG